MEAQRRDPAIPGRTGADHPTPLPLLLLNVLVATALAFATSAIGYHFGLHEGLSLALGLLVGFLYLLACEARRLHLGHGN